MTLDDATATAEAPSLDDLVALAAPEIIDHFNDGHEDVVDIIGRAHAGRGDIRSVVMTGLTPASFDVRLETDDGEVSLSVPFTPITGLTDLYGRGLELVAAAREQLGITELSSTEKEMAELSSIRTYITEVRAVERLAPRYLQVTLGGGDLSTFRSVGGEQFVYVLLPPVGGDKLTIDADFTWEEYQQLPEERRPRGAYYTVRRWRPDVGELDMIVVLHHDDPDDDRTAWVSTWAEQAAPGQPVALWGPRTDYEPPAATTHYLMVADETALPAAAAILEELPTDIGATVVIEVADADHHLPLVERDNVAVHWLHRDGARPGTTTALIDTVRGLDLSPDGLYAWGGGESHQMTAVRNHVRNDVGVGRQQCSLLAYWRLATD